MGEYIRSTDADLVTRATRLTGQVGRLGLYVALEPMLWTAGLIPAVRRQAERAGRAAEIAQPTGELAAGAHAPGAAMWRDHADGRSNGAPEPRLELEPTVVLQAVPAEPQPQPREEREVELAQAAS